MVKFYRGSASAARSYVEADHSPADDYYLAEGTGGRGDRGLDQRRTSTTSEAMVAMWPSFASSRLRARRNSSDTTDDCVCD